MLAQGEGRQRLVVAPASRQRRPREEPRRSSRRYEKLCAELGEDPANVALAWLLTRPAVDGADHRSAHQEQLTDSLRVPEIVLETATLDTLDEIFPAPFPNGSKPAPEAYAW